MLTFRSGGAQLQIMSPSVQVMQPMAGANFVGAYDNIPNIAAAYGMRRLRTAYTGNLLRLRRSSDSTSQVLTSASVTMQGTPTEAIE